MKKVQNDPAPSVLDSPRFFDDDALSAWQFQNDGKYGKQLAASNSTMKRIGLKPYTTAVRKASGQSSRLVNTDEGNPILVEIVRGVNGPQDDTWSVIIDGVLQSKEFGLEEAIDEDGTLVCTLPPAIAIDKAISKTTLVRPVVISIRLEEEALRPMSATGSFTQILNTEEHEDRDEYSEKKMDVTFNISDYRTTDLSANVTVLQYPFRAPAQSAIGILSFDAAQRQRETNKSIVAFNAFASVANGVKQSVFDARQKAYYEYKAWELAKQPLDDTLGALSKINNALVTDKKLKLNLGLYKLSGTVSKPARPSYYSERFTRDPNDFSTGKAKGSFVIGGKNTSGVQELTSLFLTLEQVCIMVQKELGKDASLERQLSTMRFALQTYFQNPEALALFDALHTADPLPTTSFLLDSNRQVSGDYWSKQERDEMFHTIRSKYVVKRCTDDGVFTTKPVQEKREAPGIDDENYGGYIPREDVEGDYEVDTLDNLEQQATEAARQNNTTLQEQLNKKNIDYFQKEDEYIKKTNLPYAFVYDRLNTEIRRRTNLSSRIDIEIRDFESAPSSNSSKSFKLRITAPEEDAYEAHAVYTNAVRQVEDLDKAATSFVECMFITHTKAQAGVRGAMNRTLDVLARLDDYFNSAFLKRVYYKNQGVKLSGIVDAMKFVTQSLMNKAFGAKIDKVVKNFDLDPCRLEERVAELRIMARQILPKPREDEVGFDSEGSKAFAKVILDAVNVDEKTKPIEPRYGVTFVSSDKTTTPPAQPPTSPGANTPNDTGINLESAHSLDMNVMIKPGSQLDRNDAEDIGVILNPYEFPDDEDDDIEKQVRENMEKTELQKQQEEDKYQFQLVKLEDIPQVNQLVIRRLPQLISASKIVYPRFTGYTFVDPLLVPASKDSFTWDSPASVVATTISGLAGFVGYLFVASKAEDLIEQWTGVKEVYNVLSSLAGAGLSMALLGGSTGGWGLFAIVAQYAGGAALQTGLEWAFNEYTPWWVPSLSFLQDVPLYKNAAVFAFRLGSYAFSFARLRIERMKVQKEIFLQFRKALTGQPINACLASAKQAIKIAKTEMERQNRDLLFGSSNTSSVVYNHMDGSRITFYQYYWTSSDSIQKDAIQDNNVMYVHSDDDWSRVPDSSAMTLLPPPDITYKLYDGQILRGIPFEQTIQFMAGKVYKDGASSIPEIAAAAAVSEVRQVVHRSRLRFRGEHIVKSEFEVAASLLENAASVLSVVYSNEKTFSLVEGDDILWSCVKGGAVARLAIRHLPMFQKVQAKVSIGAKEYFEFLKLPRRQIITEFSTAISRIAKSMPKTQTYTPIETDLLVQMVAKSFYSISSLMKGNSTVESIELALAVVASSAAHELMLTRTNDDIARTLSSFRYSIVSLLTELYQKKAPTPRPESPKHVYSNELAKTSWAYRRIDTEGSRQWKYGSIESKDKLIKELSSMDGIDQSRKVFYCAMGSSLLNAPTSHQFHAHNLSSRKINIVELENAVDILKTRITSDEMKDVQTVAILPSDSDNEVEFSRHPLSISLLNNLIYVHLAMDETDSKTSSNEVMIGNKSSDDISDLSIEMYVMDSLVNGGVDSVKLRELISASRKIGFNAERLLFALQLSRSVPVADNSSLQLKLNQSSHVISYALAIGMLHSMEDTSWGNKTHVYVPNAEEAVRLLEALKVKTECAKRAGLFTCMLSEIVLCM